MLSIDDIINTTGKGHNIFKIARDVVLFNFKIIC